MSMIKSILPKSLQLMHNFTNEEALKMLEEDLNLNLRDEKRFKADARACRVQIKRLKKLLRKK